MSAGSPNNGRVRQGKYKYTTPPWKDVYRKRCLKRFQERRSKLVDKFRSVTGDQSENGNLVKEVMEQEWNVLRREENKHLSSDSLQYNPFALRAQFESDEDFNDIIDIMEEIQNELIKEEQLMLSKYEDGLKFEEERLCAAIHSLQTDDLICPICKQNPLHQNKHIIFCACGIRIDTENDAITLEFVKTQLRDAMDVHRNEGCLEEALFSVSSYPQLGVSNLMMACKVVKNVIKVLPKYDFIWSQFHSMNSLGESDKEANEQANVKLLLQQMDTSLAEIHKNLPKGTLFVVFLRSADTRWLRKLRESGAESKVVQNPAKEIQHGLCFIKLV